MDNLETVFRTAGLDPFKPLERKPVPNVQPIYHGADYRIAIIGEAPGANETAAGQPFVGASGQLLDGLLARANINRAACFVGNVCQIQPPGNNIAKFPWESKEIQQGLAVLREDLAKFQPNLCILLGNTPLRAAQGHLQHKVTDMRGTVFRCQVQGSPMENTKCMATYHPAAVLRNYAWKRIVEFDLQRARIHGTHNNLTIPNRLFDVSLTADQICEKLSEIMQKRQTVAIDIEGYLNAMSCISVATSDSYCFIIPFSKLNGGNYWSPDDEQKIWYMLSRFLADPNVGKILQNSLYDNFVLAFGHRCPIINVIDDTMLKHWELFCELEKGLGFQASIYTNEPYYKYQRDSRTSLKEFWEYCCRDSAVTFEINERLDATLTPQAKEHYRFNVQMLRPLLYMEMRGMIFDSEAAQNRSRDIIEQLSLYQHRLNLCFGAVPTKQDVRDKCCYKRDPSRLKTGVEPALLAYLDKPELTEAEQGRMSLLAKVGVNVESPAQLAKLLYEQAGYPVQYKKDPKTGKQSVSTDVLSLLTIYRKHPDPIIRSILRMRALSTEHSTLKASCDKDGRMRSGFNVVGTETGRLTCYASPTGNGYNLQTATKSHRHFFRADPGYWFFQVDLSGADGWTVAAHCARLGDPTMLDDYKYGIKPAKVLALLYEHGPRINNIPRVELKEMCKTVDTDDWRYFAYKRVQHGTNYGMGERTMAAQILKDSYHLTGKPVYVEPRFCKQIQSLYLTRYGAVNKWHRWVQDQIHTKGYLVSASGHKRWFFGRRNDIQTFKSAYSDEPQQNTTYAINLAIFRLWTDEWNRVEVGGTTKLIVEPLHQVHDAVCGQFPKDRTEECVAALRRWLNNTLVIADQPIVIPYEGGYGPSWGELKEGTI